ncbi:MAG: helix-turn-helix domain-containing protein [Bacteroidota bacterium]
MLRLIAYKEIPQDKLITSVTDFILHTQEIVSINNLAKEHGISLRQLERRFKAKVGLTLKEFQCVTRFTRTMNSMRNKPAQSILAVAFENGYYDHSHLTNEFKKMSGSNPSSFK